MAPPSVRIHAIMDSLSISWANAAALRRASMTLHRWAEMECGDSNSRYSWCIERDEKTGRPSLVEYPHDSDHQRRRIIPDKEKGALESVSRICAPLGLYWYHQTDPRGASLYVSREPLDCQNYTRGVAIYK